MIKHNDFNRLIIKLCLSEIKYIENKRASADRDIDLISSDALLVLHFALSSIYAYSARKSEVIFKFNFDLVHELQYNFKLCIRNSSIKFRKRIYNILTDKHEILICFSTHF